MDHVFLALDAAFDGATTRSGWIVLCVLFGVIPKYGNWTFGKQRFMYVREDGIYCLTEAGRDWAHRQ